MSGRQGAQIYIEIHINIYKNLKNHPIYYIIE